MPRVEMAWVPLQMISLGSLLIQTSSSVVAAGRSRCLSEDALKNRTENFLRSYWDRLSVPADALPPRSCAQAAAEMRGDLNDRALSPWTYRLNIDVDRIPHEIAFAECLCQGCIVSQREELSYNSVQVFASLMVLRKSRCTRDPNKYVVTKSFIKVPVACTCAVPRYKT